MTSTSTLFIENAGNLTPVNEENGFDYFSGKHRYNFIPNVGPYLYGKA